MSEWEPPEIGLRPPSNNDVQSGLQTSSDESLQFNTQSAGNDELQFDDLFDSEGNIQVGEQLLNDSDLQAGDFGDLFNGWNPDGTSDEDMFHYLFNTDSNGDGAMNGEFPLSFEGAEPSIPPQTHLQQDNFSTANQDHAAQIVVNNSDNPSPFTNEMALNELIGQEQVEMQDVLEAPQTTAPDVSEQDRTDSGERDVAHITSTFESAPAPVSRLGNEFEHSHIVRQNRVIVSGSASREYPQSRAGHKTGHSRLHDVTPWKPSEGYTQHVLEDIRKQYFKNHPFLIQFRALENYHRIIKIPGVPAEPSSMSKATKWAREVALQMIETEGIFEDLMGHMSVQPDDTDLLLFQETYEYALAIARRLREGRQARARGPEFLQAFETEMRRALDAEMKDGKTLNADQVEAVRQVVSVKLDMELASQTTAAANLEAEKNRILGETLENLRRSNIPINDAMYQNLVVGAENMARSRLEAAAASDQVSVQLQSPQSTPDLGSNDGSEGDGDNEDDEDNDNGNGNGSVNGSRLIAIPEILMRPPPRGRFDDPKDIAAICAQVSAQEAASAQVTPSPSPKKKRGRRAASTDTDEPSAKRISPDKSSDSKSASAKGSDSKPATPKRTPTKRTPPKKKTPSKRNNSTSSSTGSSNGVIVREDGSVFFQVKDMEAAKAHMMKYGGESSPASHNSGSRQSQPSQRAYSSSSAPASQTPLSRQSQSSQRSCGVSRPMQQQPSSMFGAEDTVNGPYAPGMSGRTSGPSLFGGPTGGQESPPSNSGATRRFVPLTTSTRDAPTTHGYPPSLSQTINAAQASRGYPVDLGTDVETALSGVFLNSPEDEDMDL